MQHIWFWLILRLGRPLGGQREQWVPVFLWTLRSLWIKLAHRLGSLSCLFAFRWKSLPANLGRGNFHERGKLMTEVSQSASETPARNFPKILKIPEKMSLCHVFVAVLTWFLPESNQVPLWDWGPKSTSPRNCPIYWPRCNPRDLIGSQIMKGRFLVAKIITHVVCHIASTCWQSGLLGLLRNKWFRKTSQMLVQICLEAVARVIWMFFPRSLSVMMKPTAYFISIIGQSLNLIWFILI